MKATFPGQGLSLGRYTSELADPSVMPLVRIWMA